MADWTYNTDHGNFLLKSCNKEPALKALLGQSKELVAANLEDALAHLGFGIGENEEGDIVDIFLATAVFSEENQHILTDVIGPFVEDGSFLVFYGSGTNGCWAINWIKDSAKVGGMVSDVDCVLRYDLLLMLKELEKGDQEFFRRMKEKYGGKR